MSKSLAKILEIIGIDFDDFEKDIDNLYAKKVKKMIDDAESIADDLRNMNDYKDKDKVLLNIENASIAFRNAHKFDKNDAKLVFKQDISRLIKAIEIINTELHRFYYHLHSNLLYYRKHIKEDDNEDKDDLESLSKEELIARLREKSK